MKKGSPAPEGQIACQDRARAKGFGMKKKPGPQVRSVYYWLKCCMEARFRKLAKRRKEVRNRVIVYPPKVTLQVNNYC